MGTIVVTTTADTVDADENITSLREAVTLANFNTGADTIVFAPGVSGGLIRVSSTLNITEALTIDGDINGDDRPDVTLTGDASDNDITIGIANITDIAASTGLLADNVQVLKSTAALTLNGLVITGGSGVDGGGVFAAGDLAVTNSTISGNMASGDGGGVNGQSLVNLTDTALSGNVATNGGAVFSTSIATLENVTLSGNTASGNGGALQASIAKVYTSTITGNSADGSGDAFRTTGGGGLEIANSITIANGGDTDIASNVSGATVQNGGKIFGSDVTTALATFANLAANGGGLLSTDPNGVQYVSLKVNSGNYALDRADFSATGFDYANNASFNFVNVVNANNSARDLGAFEVLNPAPTAVSTNTVTTTEDTPSEAVNIGATDIDGTSLTYTVKSSAQPSKGTVVFTGDTFTYTPNADANGADAFTIVIRDANTATVEQTVTVGITAVDDAPTALGLTNTTPSIAENTSTSARIKVADIAVTDIDGGSNAFTLTGADSAAFEVLDSSLYLRAGTSLDFETKSSFSVAVVTGALTSTTYTLNVGNVTPEIINGTSSANTLTGSSDNDWIYGFAGKDKLFGLAGDDYLNGGKDRDILTGGEGKDTFDFNNKSHSGTTGTTRDLITDFNGADDVIDLLTIDASSKTAGNGAFTFIETSGFHKVAGELRYSQKNVVGTDNDRTIVAGDVNGDGKADFQIALKGLITLAADDFIL